MNPQRNEIDFEIRDLGSVWIFYPRSQEARDLAENDLELEPWQRWAGPSFVVEHRPAHELTRTLEAEGYKIAIRG